MEGPVISQTFRVGDRATTNYFCGNEELVTIINLDDNPDYVYIRRPLGRGIDRVKVDILKKMEVPNG
jgi:hypothetical protein